MAVGDIVQLTAVGSGQGQAILHTIHFKCIVDPADTLGPEQNIIDSWQTGGQPAFLAGMPTWYTLEARRATHVFGTPLRATIEEGSVNTAGDQASNGTEQLAPWLSVLVRQRTALKGKRYSGRFFVPAGWEYNVSSQTIVSAIVTLWQTYGTNLLTVYGPSGTNANWRLVTYSRTAAALSGATTSTVSAQVISVSPSTVLTTTRSRRG